MRFLMDMATIASVLGMSLAAPAPGGGKRHRIAVQVNQDDPAVMNLALNNVANMAEYYRRKGEEFQIEVVTYGPGLHMLRDDTSPVKERIEQLVASLPPDCVRFCACTNTKQTMEKREGREVAVVPQASFVPSSAVRLVELQEQGWSYLRP